MANWTINNIKITGVSAAVPKEIVETKDFDFFSAEEAATFDKTVGDRKSVV